MIMRVHVKIHFTSFSCTSSTSTRARNFAEVPKCKPPTSNNTLQLLKIFTNTKRSYFLKILIHSFCSCEKYISHKTNLPTPPQSTICTFYLVIQKATMCELLVFNKYLFYGSHRELVGRLDVSKYVRWSTNCVTAIYCWLLDIDYKSLQNKDSVS